MNQTGRQRKMEKKRRQAAKRQAKAKGKHVGIKVFPLAPTQFMTGQG